MSDEGFSAILRSIATGMTLDVDQSARAFSMIMAGQVS